MSKDYVAGFLFNEPMSLVVLVRKQKPEWQAGKLNAVGGKIEENETPFQAMEREFAEETGLVVDNWKPLCVLCDPNGNYAPNWRVCFFYAVVSFGTMRKVRTIEAEEIDIYKSEFRDDMIPNLEWLIPMAKSLNSGRERATHFGIDEQYKVQ